MYRMKTDFIKSMHECGYDSKGSHPPVTILTSYGEVTGIPFVPESQKEGPTNQIEIASFNLDFMHGADPFDPWDKRLLHLKDVIIITGTGQKKSVSYITVFSDQIIGVLSSDNQESNLTETISSLESVIENAQELQDELIDEQEELRENESLVRAYEKNNVIFLNFTDDPMDDPNRYL